MSFPSSTRSSSLNFTQATDIASAHRQEDPNGPPRNQSIIYTFKASIWGGTRTIIRRAGFPGFRWNIQKAHNFDKIRIPSTTAARSQAELIGKVFDAANYVLPMGTAKDPLSLANCIFLSSASSSGGHSAVVELALNPHNPITITEIRSLCTTVNPLKKETVVYLTIVHVVDLPEEDEDDNGSFPKAQPRSKGVKREAGALKFIGDEPGQSPLSVISPLFHEYYSLCVAFPAGEKPRMTSNLRAKSVVKEEKETKVKKGRDSVASTLAKKTQATQNIKQERTCYPSFTWRSDAALCSCGDTGGSFYICLCV